MRSPVNINLWDTNKNLKKKRERKKESGPQQSQSSVAEPDVNKVDGRRRGSACPGPAAGGAGVTLHFWEFRKKDPPLAARVGGPRRVLTGSQPEKGAGLGR